MMGRVTLTTALAAALLLTGTLATRVLYAGAGQASAPADPDSWQIPPNAAEEKNPVEATPQVLKKGLQLYGQKCERCHGTAGKGDGPDGDPDMPPEDLSNAERARHNPDGVVFYKVWNGRKKPKMPAFKTDLSKTDVWTIVHYVRKLRE